MESTANHLGRKHKVTPEDILRHSWELFSASGYNQTTMAEIAEGVGISRRSLFNYFPQKEALLFPGLAHTLNAFSDELLSRPTTEPLLASIEKSMWIVDQAANEFEGSYIPTEEIMLAQSSPSSISYIREYTVSRMRTVALERYASDTHPEIKAGLVAAITAQILTEAINLSSNGDSRTQRKNVKLVMSQLAQLFTDDQRTVG